MNKIQKFAFTLSIALAAVLTFSCSSDSSDDDDNVGGGGLSGLHAQKAQQVYYNGEAFNGSSDVVLVLYKEWSDGNNNILTDELPAGKIENGKITLNLSSSIDSKYLRPFRDYCKLEKDDLTSKCINELKDVLYTNGYLYANTSDKGLCELELKTDDIDSYEYASLIYLQKSGRVKYDATSSGDKNGYPEDVSTDWNFSKGWNTEYEHVEIGKYIYSTNPSIIKGELKWQLVYCQGGNDDNDWWNDDDDYNYNYNSCTDTQLFCHNTDGDDMCDPIPSYVTESECNSISDASVKNLEWCIANNKSYYCD